MHSSHNIESSMNIASPDNAVKFTINPSQLFIYIPSLVRYLELMHLTQIMQFTDGRILKITKYFYLKKILSLNLVQKKISLVRANFFGLGLNLG